MSRSHSIRRRTIASRILGSLAEDVKHLDDDNLVPKISFSLDQLRSVRGALKRYRTELWMPILAKWHDDYKSDSKESTEFAESILNKGRWQSKYEWNHSRDYKKYCEAARLLQEIVESLERLAEIAMYAGCKSPVEGDYKKVRWTEFLVNSYIDEVYVLRERLLSYIHLLRKLAPVDRRGGTEFESTEMLCNLFFKKISKVRGTRVHSDSVPLASVNRAQYWASVGTRDRRIQGATHLVVGSTHFMWVRRFRRWNRRIVLFVDLFGMVVKKDLHGYIPAIDFSRTDLSHRTV